VGGREDPALRASRSVGVRTGTSAGRCAHRQTELLEGLSGGGVHLEPSLLSGVANDSYGSKRAPQESRKSPAVLTESIE
jgi:hypothetical protein